MRNIFANVAGLNEIGQFECPAVTSGTAKVTVYRVGTSEIAEKRTALDNLCAAADYDINGTENPGFGPSGEGIADFADSKRFGVLRHIEMAVVVSEELSNTVYEVYIIDHTGATAEVFSMDGDDNSISLNFPLWNVESGIYPAVRALFMAERVLLYL